MGYGTGKIRLRRSQLIIHAIATLPVFGAAYILLEKKSESQVRLHCGVTKPVHTL